MATGVPGPIIQPKIQKNQVQVVVNQQHLKHGYVEFQIPWLVPFADTNYEVTGLAHCHHSTDGEQGKAAYVMGGYRDKEKDYILVVLPILPNMGAKVGDNIEACAKAEHA